jgi:Transposase DDE domain
MDREHLITSVYCIVDDCYKKLTEKERVRQRGPLPNLSDSEAITIEIAGEILGLHADKEIWSYFNDHWKNLFPTLTKYSSFVKQCANIFGVKEMIFKKLFSNFSDFHITDGVPIPVCHVVRRKRDRCFKGHASVSYCAAKKEYYYGLKGHVLIDANQEIKHFVLTSANVDERDILPQYMGLFTGRVIADKGLISQILKEDLAQHDIDLQTPLRKNMKDDRSEAFVQELLKIRRLVETVIGQLCEGFDLNKCRAKTFWHLNSKLIRKILAYNFRLKLAVK